MLILGLISHSLFIILVLFERPGPNHRIICQPAHVIVVVNETRSSAVARFVPQDASVVYKSAENHGCRYRPQNPNFDPLYTQSERSLIVAHDPQRGRERGHRAEEGHEHVTERQDDEQPQVRARACAGGIDSFVLDDVPGIFARQIHRRRVYTATVRVYLNEETFIFYVKTACLSIPIIHLGI